jgi:hypothetical protein
MILHFLNGESYRLDNRVIALARTNYYAKEYGIEKNTEDWEDLFNESADQSLIEDWFKNNISFEDIKDSLVKVERKQKSLEDLFDNQDYEFII